MNLRNMAAAAVLSVMASGSHATTVPHDVFFMMDGSGSLGQSDFNKMLDFVGTAVKDYVDPEGTSNRVGFGLFSDDVTVEYRFFQQQANTPIINKLNSLTYPTGLTAIRSAVEKAIDEFNALSVINKRTLFLITDGSPVPSFTESVCPPPLNTRMLLDDSNVTTYIIGVGASFFPDAVSCLVDDPDSQIVEIDSFTQLNADAIFTPLALGGPAPAPSNLPAPVPLPAGLPLLLCGLGGLVLVRRKTVTA